MNHRSPKRVLFERKSLSHSVVVVVLPQVLGWPLCCVLDILCQFRQERKEFVLLRMILEGRNMIKQQTEVLPALKYEWSQSENRTKAREIPPPSTWMMETHWVSGWSLLPGGMFMKSVRAPCVNGSGKWSCAFAWHFTVYKATLRHFSRGHWWAQKLTTML